MPEQKKVVHRLVPLSIVKLCMLYADITKEWVSDRLIVYFAVFPVVLSRELRINYTGFRLLASVPANTPSTMNHGKSTKHG
jgi:hypothetical protein